MANIEPLGPALVATLKYQNERLVYGTMRDLIRDAKQDTRRPIPGNHNEALPAGVDSAYFVRATTRRSRYSCRTGRPDAPRALEIAGTLH